jgi:hypothetical protein
VSGEDGAVIKCSAANHVKQSQTSEIENPTFC